jgi:hypothetical protein
MDDLASMITQLLNSEEGMQQLRSVASALGLSDQPAGAAGQASPDFGPAADGAPPPAKGGFGDLSSLFGSAGQSSSGAPPLDLNTAMLLGRAMSALGQDDSNIQLLRALKPHFSDERAKKVDDAIRILQLIRLLPLLRDSGLLGFLKGEGT